MSYSPVNKLWKNWRKITDEDIILERSRETVSFYSKMNENIISKFGVINDSVSNLQRALKE